VSFKAKRKKGECLFSDKEGEKKKEEKRKFFNHLVFLFGLWGEDLYFLNERMLISIVPTSWYIVTSYYFCFDFD